MVQLIQPILSIIFGSFLFQANLVYLSIIPECVQGFPFHSGGLGVEGVFARRCVHGRNRPQFATVRNRPQPFV